MTPSDRAMAFRPDPELAAAMTTLQERDGINYSEQIRRALRAWLTEKGVMKPERKRATTRKRS